LQVDDLLTLERMPRARPTSLDVAALADDLLAGGL
jgi:hypothetical protein